MQFRHDKFLTICMFVVDLINGLSDELTKRTIADSTIRLTIRPILADLTTWLTNRLTIQLTIRLYNSALRFRLQFGWPKWVKISEHPSSDSTVVQSGCLVSRPSLADVSRIGHSNGKGNPWQGQFLVASF